MRYISYLLNKFIAHKMVQIIRLVNVDTRVSQLQVTTFPLIENQQRWTTYDNFMKLETTQLQSKLIFLLILLQ